MDKPPPTTEQLKQQWNAFAPAFSSMLTRQTDVSAFQLLTQLQLHKEEVHKIVEVGCGGGGGTTLITQLMRPGTTVVAFDLSQSFLEIAKKRLEGKNVEFHEGSSEELPLTDASFDRYVANFVLHLVTNPEQMLREARRVLRPGGVAAFSVWGRPENSPFWTLSSAVQKEVGIGSEPTVRTNFHLGVDPEKTRKMILDAGFSRVLYWYSVVPIEAANTSEVVAKYLASPMLQKILAGIDEEKKSVFLEKLSSKIEEEFYSQSKPICTETLFFLAYA